MQKVAIKPYIIETKNYLIVSVGGAYNKETLRETKRGEISSFSRQSLKRFCLLQDLLCDFEPRYLLVLRFQNLDTFIKQYTIMKSYCFQLSRLHEIFNHKKALFIWKRRYDNCGKIIFYLITNFHIDKMHENPVETHKIKFSGIYKTKSKKPEIKISYRYIFYNRLPVQKFFSDEYKYCRLKNIQYKKIKNKIPGLKIGRTWGIIGLKSYRKLSPIKNHITKEKAKTLEEKLHQESTYKSYLYNDNFFIKKS